MARECQAKNQPQPLEPGDFDLEFKQRVFGREVKLLSRDPKFIDEVLRRRSNGDGLEKIATDLKCHRNTVVKVIKQNGGDPLGRVTEILRNGMPQVADMVIRETLRKKDVRAGVELLRGAGQLDTLKPKPTAEDGGRIVIEWSGAPPPWAPAPVLKAYAQRQVEAAVPTQVRPVIEGPPASVGPAIPGPLHTDIQDAEIVQNRANAQDS